MTATGAGSPAAEPPLELVARFKEALDRLWPEGGRLGLAVSGGPDSLAMLLLAEAAIPGQFEVATVDHGLRPESAGECAMVAEICAERGVPCQILSVEIEAGNLQSKARVARYAALAGWAQERGLSAVATAHHADDQAETFLMRLNRGSGVAGLAGVRERGAVPGTDLPLIRPLLGCRRAELDAAVQGSNLVPVSDPSNVDDRFERARLRKALAEADWLDLAAIAAAAANFGEADEALEWAARREWAERAHLGDSEVRYSPGAPRAVVLRVVERVIAHFGGAARGGDVARLVDGLVQARSGNLGGVLATAEGDEWVFRPEPPRRTG